MSLLLFFTGEHVLAGQPAPTGVYLVPIDGGQIVFWTEASGAAYYNVYVKAGTTVSTSSYDDVFTSLDTDRTITDLTNWIQTAFGVTAVSGAALESTITDAVLGMPGLILPTVFGVMINPANYPYTTFAVRGTWWRQTNGVTLATTATQAVVGAMIALAAALETELRLCLTVRWDGASGTPDSGPIGSSQLTTWATNLATYLATYTPEAIAVLNEEPSATFSSLTAAQYLAALEAAYDVAHPLGIKVANGGLVWNGAALCYYAHLLEDVSTTAAHTFAGIAFPAGADQTALMAATALTDLSSTIQTVISKNRDFLLNVYQATSKMDYMNIHVHWPESSAGIDAVRQVLAWYASATGLPIITNESNIETTDADLLIELLELYEELQLPIAIQYSVTSGSSTALQDTDASLRDTGEAWRDFMVGRYLTTVPVLPPARDYTLTAPARDYTLTAPARTYALTPEAA